MSKGNPNQDFENHEGDKLCLEDFTLLLTNLSYDNVRDMLEMPDPETIDEQYLTKKDDIITEMMYFTWFSLDYWLSQAFRNNVKLQEVISSLYSRWVYIMGIKDNYLLKERLDSYTSIINSSISDEAKLYMFGKKLSEYCGIEGHPFLLFSVPGLFTATMKCIFNCADYLE